jgi:dTDP-4-amino-4,6-dideoxygalactose transaminase
MSCTNIPLFKVYMSQEVVAPLSRVIMSGQITQGPEVEKFESILKEYIGNEYLLTLNSATSGLTLALQLLKQKDSRFDWDGFNVETDVVLTPALTCFATTASILANNVNIRWVDIDINTSNVCLKDIKNKLTKNTKIIYVVHWGGTPVDIDGIREIQEYSVNKFGFRPMIVEDCAHAFGAEYNSEKIGGRASHGNICVFSLQAIKHLTTGDGGIITLPNKYLYDRCKLLRWYGIDRDKRNYKANDYRLENDIIEHGYKFHMNDINATIGIYNFPHISDIINKHQQHAKYYNDQLKDLSGIKLMQQPTNSNSVYWVYSLRILNNKKEEFIYKMKCLNITTSQVHNRNDINSCVKQFKECLKNLDILEKELVCIPVGWWLTNEDLKRIIDSIKMCINN